jgi:hypothetical protein
LVDILFKDISQDIGVNFVIASPEVSSRFQE